METRRTKERTLTRGRCLTPSFHPPATKGGGKRRLVHLDLYCGGEWKLVRALFYDILCMLCCWWKYEPFHNSLVVATGGRPPHPSISLSRSRASSRTSVEVLLVLIFSCVYFESPFSKAFVLYVYLTHFDLGESNE